MLTPRGPYETRRLPSSGAGPNPNSLILGSPHHVRPSIITGVPTPPRARYLEVLEDHCFECHGDGEKLRGDVDLRLRRFMLKKTDEGHVLSPGKPQDSLIVKLIESGKMQSQWQ